MLTFGAPQYAWFLALPAGIVVLYLLRRKYVPKQVPSTFLWKSAIRDHAANKPFQRLRKNLLLPVQFLAALILALALMQPNLSRGTASRTVMIFDLSGSMQTVSDGKSRLEEAKDRAEEILRGLPPGEEITVLAAGGEARTGNTGRESVRQILTGSTDREDARQAIRSLVCGRGGADLDRAVSLAEAIRREDPERGARIIVFSDSYTPKTGITAENVGRGEENRGIYAISAEEGSAYARICNFGGDCTVTVICEADGRLCEARETEIPAGETAGVSFTVPEGAEKVTVRIREADALPADNEAEAAVRRNVTQTVALTGDNLFLESALQVRKDLRVVRTDEESFAKTAAELYIYGTSPLIFSRDPSQTAFSWPEEEKEITETLTAEDTPMTEGVTLRNVALRSGKPLEGGKTAIRAGSETLAAYTDTEAALGFRLQDSNLPLKYDFPVLVQNILNMLLPQTVDTAAETEPPMDAQESDVRTVAQGSEGEAGAAAGTRGQDLTGLLMGVFLALLMIEFVLAREPWTRKRIQDLGFKI